MSHEELTDLRIRRTQKFLQEAIIELITEKGFDSSWFAARMREHTIKLMLERERQI